MLEKNVRQNFIAELKKNGKEAFPIESAVTPGFPDVVVAGFTTSLFELKVVPTRASAKHLADLFQPQQRAFLTRWWTTQADGLWCLIYDEHDKILQALRINPLILEKPLANLLTYGVASASMSGLIKNIRSQL